MFFMDVFCSMADKVEGFRNFPYHEANTDVSCYILVVWILTMVGHGLQDNPLTTAQDGL